MADRPWTKEDDGLRLAVRLTPRGGRDMLGAVAAGLDGRSVLTIRVAAPPVDGAANKALIAFLAEALGIPRSSVAIRSGAAARQKIVALTGDPDALETRLARAIDRG